MSTATAGTRGGLRRVLRAATSPLRTASTLLAGVYLVLGGVVAGAYGVLVIGFAQMFATETLMRPGVVILAAVAAAIVLVPPFLGAVRTLEILAVHTFLDVDLPVPSGSTPLSPATRWRAAAWYGLHLTLGAAVTFAVLFAVPMAVQLALAAAGADRSLLAELVPQVPGTNGVVLPALLAVLIILALPYAAALARAVLRQAAGPLLGPDQSERIAELEAAARRSAERGRLARDLHDSVGHALTITTLQAAAAARRLESDPETARRALAAIEETGRAAMTELDHVLHLLRDSAGDSAGYSADDSVGDSERRSGGSPTTPVRTLADLPLLVEDARAAGADVTLGRLPELLDVPRATSREAYRVVQEALTNALRHAPGTPVTVQVWLLGGDRGRTLTVEVTNPLPDGEASHAVSAGVGGAGGGGRGLPGMAERVRLIGGQLEAGPDDSRWVVHAGFALPARGSEP